MSRPSLVLGFAAAMFLAAAATTPPASADTFDKLTFLTFSGPVQIPGQTTLGAGTYRFRLANPSTGRNVIQVLSNDGYYVYGMFHTIPDYRSTVTEEPTVTFREAPAGVAPPIKSLFYGGETYGYEFLYGKGEPNLIPLVLPQPPITYTANVVPAEPVVVEPAPEPIAPAPAIEPIPEPVTEPELPATASPLPLIAFGGVASALAGLGVGLLRRRLL